LKYLPSLRVRLSRAAAWRPSFIGV
jgi:hypothetical protein